MQKRLHAEPGDWARCEYKTSIGAYISKTLGAHAERVKTGKTGSPPRESCFYVYHAIYKFDIPYAGMFFFWIQKGPQGIYLHISLRHRGARPLTKYQYQNDNAWAGANTRLGRNEFYTLQTSFVFGHSLHIANKVRHTLPHSTLTSKERQEPWARCQRRAAGSVTGLLPMLR